MQNKPTIGILFISGAGLDANIWNVVKEQLDIPTIAVDYTELKQQAPLDNISLQQYVSTAINQADALPTDKIVIVAHSIGGVVGVEVVKQLRDKTAGFVAIAAAIPGPKASFVSLLPFPRNLVTKLILKLAGTKPPVSAIKSGLCNDLTDEQANQIVTNFSPESIRLYTDSTTTLSIPSVPSLYIATDKDNEYSALLQQKMANNLKSAHTETINTGHLPMISRPADLAEKINTFLKGV